MPLIVEVHATDGSWREVGKLSPGVSGSVSDNKPDGRRDVYVFECDRSDSYATLLRATRGADVEQGDKRVLFTEGFDEIARFSMGEYYLLQVKTDQSPEPRTLRFRHER